MIVNQKPELEFKVSINGNEINNQKTMKILGINLSNDLKFDHHVWKGPGNMVKSVAYKTSILKTLKPFLPLKSLAAIGDSLINSTLMYGAPLWGATSEANISRLQNAQIKAGRVITGQGPRKNRSHRQTMLKTLGWPNIRQLITTATLNLAKNGIEQVSSEGLNTMFKVTTPRLQRTHLTMRLDHRGPLKRKATIFSAKAAHLFNTLPSELKSPKMSTKFFKTKIKEHVASKFLLKEH